jgi:hypothetical protein
MKKGRPEPAHARWSSEKESVRVAVLRPLVWTAGFLETSFGKHLEQLRRDRLVEHILSAADQRFVEIDMRRARWSPGPRLADTSPPSVPPGNPCQEQWRATRDGHRCSATWIAGNGSRPRRPSVSWKHTTRAGGRAS